MSVAIPREAAQALLNRAITGLLFSASINAPDRAQFWRGSINALRGVLDTERANFMARKDASCAYQPPAGLEAAWAALPDNIERLSFAEVQQFLAAQGVQITTHTIANSQVDAVLQFKDREVATVNLNDEHAAHAVDVSDGSKHAEPSDVLVIVTEGGAA